MTSYKKNKQYLAYIKGKSCLFHGTPNPDPHHLRARGMGGFGQKSSDFECIPLCRKCHVLIHNKGIKEFERLTQLNVYKDALQLVVNYLDIDK